jgi:hypothetical protein
MNKVIRWLEDQLLAIIQRRCQHPDEMVAADILEACAPGIQVRYCRRCGSVKTDWDPKPGRSPFASIPHYWRSPDPNLWRG